VEVVDPETRLVHVENVAISMSGGPAPSEKSGPRVTVDHDIVLPSLTLEPPDQVRIDGRVFATLRAVSACDPTKRPAERATPGPGTVEDPVGDAAREVPAIRGAKKDQVDAVPAPRKFLPLCDQDPLRASGPKDP
jgi:hypothetical protein